MRETNQKSRFIKIAVLLLIVAVAGGVCLQSLHRAQAAKRADRVIEQMQEIVPGLGTETGIPAAGDAGTEPLPQITVDGVDIVGYLEVPALGITAPVTAGGAEAGLAALDGGAPLSEQFRITGSRRDVFRRLAAANPGDKVAFTDINGVRYTYEVTTQFHLQEWDDADNDLLLFYRTGPHTCFVVGCKRLQ